MMAGGTRIVAFDVGSQSTPAENNSLTEDPGEPTEPRDELAEGHPEPSVSRGWLPVLMTALMLAGWTIFFGWAMRQRLLISDPEQWVALVGNWAMPAALICVVGLLAMRNSRREAHRFGDAARMLSAESARLEERLSVVNRELSLAREFIAAQSRDLETLGRLAADRLSAEADRLQGLIRENHTRVEAIGSVSEAALDNMEKLRGQLPVIASSAKDVTNNIGNAGRTAHAQLQEMINGFRKLNEFGQASERQVHSLRDLADGAVAEFARHADQLGELAASRFATLHAQGAEFRTQLETHEIEALAAVRTRAAAMADELEDTRRLLDGHEAESLTSMRARLASLRDESSAISRAVREGEVRALETWEAAVARIREDLQGTLQTLDEAEDKAIQATQMRLNALGNDLASRRTEAFETEEQATARLHHLLASLDDEIASRRAAHDRLAQESTERLDARLAALDEALRERRARHEEQGSAIVAQAETIARSLEIFEHRVAEIAAQGSAAEHSLTASLGALGNQLAASRSALSGTEAQVAGLTDSSVRLLELIQASAKHGAEDLPRALGAGKAQLSEIEVRMAALQEAARDADARGVQLSETVTAADEGLRRTYADLGELQASLEKAGTTHAATLATLRHDLEVIAANSAQLVEDSRGKLADALSELSRITREAVEAFADSGSVVVARLARQLGAESAVSIEAAMRASASDASAELERAATAAAAIGREATLQLRDQLAKVNELAANLESRVAHARQRAEEQVDNDFTRRVALITESLNSNAIDIAKALSTDVSETAWTAYLRGDRGIFTRRAVSLVEGAEAKAIVQLYERDRDFHEHVSRYIHDFEAMLRQVLSARDGKALGVTLLSSDMGKLYVVLAQAIERLR